MGGEVLVRPDFVHKVVDYAVKKDFFVYLPTNGRLMKPSVIDKLADAGVANWNLAIDSVDGPAKYNLSKDADVTVLLYKDRVVVANYAFGKGKLGAKDVETIVADVAKIVK